MLFALRPQQMHTAATAFLLAGRRPQFQLLQDHALAVRILGNAPALVRAI